MRPSQTRGSSRNSWFLFVWISVHQRHPPSWAKRSCCALRSAQCLNSTSSPSSSTVAVSLPSTVSATSRGAGDTAGQTLASVPAWSRSAAAGLPGEADESLRAGAARSSLRRTLRKAARYDSERRARSESREERGSERRVEAMARILLI